MTARSPVTPTKSLRDRIAKFEGSEGAVLKSHGSGRGSRISKSKPAATGRTGPPPTMTSPNQAMQGIASLKPPATPPSAFSSSSNDSGTVEEVGDNITVSQETVQLARTDALVDDDPLPNASRRAAGLSENGQSTSLTMASSSALVIGDSDNGTSSTTTKEQSAPVVASPLDALLSPVDPQITQVVEVKDSMADQNDDNEEDVEDVRFSMVPLSGKAFDENGKVMPDSAFSSGPPSVDGMDQLEDITGAALNKSSNGDALEAMASPRTLFFKHRLEKQEESLDLNLGSNYQFQEELSRLQSATTSSAEEAEHIDWEFWGAVMADYHQYARENSDQLASAIECGIPNSLRGMMWQLMAASKDPDLEVEYARLLKETSAHEKSITRDLGRTFPQHDFFMDGQGIGQENLFNVLKAYSLYDAEVGYCQGLPFVVAILLLNMPDEEAFCLLVRLMSTYGLRGHFLPEMPALQLRLFQFDKLVEDLLPVLHIHFLRQGVKSSMYCSQWFLTMFSYRFPLEVVFRIFDNVLATGIEAIFGFSIALLQKNEAALLKLKFDEILGFLRNSLFEAYKVELGYEKPTYLVDLFVREAALVRITPLMLDAYAHEYQESVREREAYAIEMDNLRNINRNLSVQIKALEASLAQLNTEHCEIVKELVMSRLANEEMEGELVRYKLLYADLMHKSEDAGSSHRLSTKSKAS